MNQNKRRQVCRGKTGLGGEGAPVNYKIEMKLTMPNGRAIEVSREMSERSGTQPRFDAVGNKILGCAVDVWLKWRKVARGEPAPKEDVHWLVDGIDSVMYW